MGYTTNFTGKFKLNRKLREADAQFLRDLAHTRRMKRKGLHAKYGIDGEFYMGAGTADRAMGQDDNFGVVDANKPPSTQPGLWCQWVPTEDDKGIEWDGNEKFYDYVEWITYIIDKILAPRGYTLNGEVTWQGEDSDDQGMIVVKNNKVSTKHAVISYEDD